MSQAGATSLSSNPFQRLDPRRDFARSWGSGEKAGCAELQPHLPETLIRRLLGLVLAIGIGYARIAAG
jgi:hypothetical protein